MQKTRYKNSRSGQVSDWTLFEHASAIEEAACNRILDAAKSAIQARGQFLIVLAGGTTPKKIYQQLASMPADWAHWHVFHNDDRCLPVDHPERNSKMARDAWLNHVPIPQTQIYDIPAELGNVAGAAQYAQLLSTVPSFDLVLLGLGEDGHTASLFPGHAIDNRAAAVPVFDAPKPPPERITMSQQRLSDTRAVLFLVTGSGKQAAVDQWLAGVDIPATVIAPPQPVEVYCADIRLSCN